MGNFLEIIEWFDDTGKEIAHRIPEEGSGDIKYGAQLTVRESQAAIFFYEGKAYDAVGAGRYTLTTLNIPIITKLLSLPWGFTSPLRAEVYFINTKIFRMSTISCHVKSVISIRLTVMESKISRSLNWNPCVCGNIFI